MDVFRCNVCSEKKPVAAFYRSKLYPVTLTGICKVCQIAGVLRAKAARKRDLWARKKGAAAG